MFQKKEKFWFHKQLSQTSHCNAWRGVNGGHYLVCCFVATVMKIIHYSLFLSCKTGFSPLAQMMNQCDQCVWPVFGADQHFYCFLFLSPVSALILMLKTPSTNTISSLWFWAPSRKKNKIETDQGLKLPNMRIKPAVHSSSKIIWGT